MKMLDINIVTENLKLCCSNIECEFDNILKMYNDIDTYLYATGVTYKLEKWELIQRIYYDLNLSNSFFSYAKTIYDNIFIGYINGYIREKYVFWLSIIMIDKIYINKGFGSEIVIGVERFLKKNYKIKKIYISVNALNVCAINFWSKLGFKEENKLKKDNQVIYIYIKDI